MKIRRTITFFMALALSAGLVSCGDKKSSSSKEENKKSATYGTTPALSGTAVPSTTERETVDWQKLHDDYQDSVSGKDDTESGIKYHTDRPHDGYYLEDYVTVKFTGYEHDSAVEMSVDWDAAAADLGNGVTSEMLEAIFNVDIRNTEDKYDRFKMDDLVNGDMVVLHMDESTKYETYEMKYPDEMEYIDEKLWYYTETPVFAFGLKTKVFLDNTSDVDKAEIQKLTDAKMNEIKDSAKDYADSLIDDYESGIVWDAYDWKYDIMGNTHYITIKDFKAEKTYLAKRTASSYNDTSASMLPENMVYNIYKLTVERYGTGEVLDLYYRAEVSNILFEDEKMLVSDETVKVQFAAKAEELVPDSKYWEIEEVK